MTDTGLDEDPVRYGEADTRDDDAERRPLLRSLWRGFVGRCPNCAEGSLFRTWLRPVDECAACGEDYRGQRADDLPPYLVIFVVGHVVVAGFMAGEMTFELTAWQHLAIWVPITLLMSLALIRPFKGATIGLQWALRMAGFDGGDEAAEKESEAAAHAGR